jgi:hypothetical protein
MNSRAQSTVPSNLVGYSFRAFSSESAGHTVADVSLSADNDEASSSETHVYGMEICHLIGDMTLEEDCA